MCFSPEYVKAKQQMEIDYQVELQQYNQEQPPVYNQEQPQNNQQQPQYAQQQPMVANQVAPNQGFMIGGLPYNMIEQAQEMSTFAHEIQLAGNFMMAYAWKSSVLIYCTLCKKYVDSVVQTNLSTNQWVMIIVLTPILLCWTPLINSDGYSYHHHCPDCKKNLRQVRPLSHTIKFSLC